MKINISSIFGKIRLLAIIGVISVLQLPLMCEVVWAGPLSPGIAGMAAGLMPVVDGVMPSTLIQGQVYTLVLRGGHFDLLSGARIDLGLGIQATGPVTVLNPNMAQMQVQVASSAPAGLRPVIVTFSGQTHNGPAMISVMSAPSSTILGGAAPSSTIPGGAVPSTIPLIRMQQISVVTVSPNQWSQGTAYQLILNGTNFAPGMEIQFGSGIKNKGPLQILSPNLARLEVDVAADAPAGPHHAQWRAASQQPWNNASATAWVSSAVRSASPPKLKLASLALDFLKGKIVLSAPAWGKTKTGGDVQQNLGVPLLDDELVFEWREENPGLAEYFELHILDPNGKVLLNERIDGNTTYFRPGAATLTQLLNPDDKRASAAGTEAMPELRAARLATMVAATHMNGGMGITEPIALLSADLYWEVVGYRLYAKNGVIILHAQNGPDTDSKKDEVTVEVERSDKWPLRKPDRPNGFQACPVDGTHSGWSLSPEAGTGDAGGKAAYYPGDDIVLGGTINLDRSPYASHPKEVDDPKSQSFSNNVMEHRFDNLFVDWGDGTVEPLNVNATDKNGKDGNAFGRKSGDLSFPIGGTTPYTAAPPPYSPNTLHHSYATSGTYWIKVYQLPEADVQQGALFILPPKAKGNLAHGSNPYFQLVSSSLSSDQSDISSHAYVFYCQSFTAEPVKDAAAFAPIQLKSVSAPSFPGHEDTGGGGDQTKRVKLIARKTSSSVLSMNKGAGGGEKIPPGVCSTCDKSLTAHAKLMHIGEGDVEVTWKVDGQVVGAKQIVHVPASVERTGNPKKWGDPISSSWPLDSPVNLPIGKNMVGKEPKVTVEVKVHKTFDVTRIASQINGGGLGESGGLRHGGDSQLAKTTKIGFMRPFNEAVKGAPTVAYVSPEMLKSVLASQDGPPDFVVSPPNKYRVVASNPNLPCKFDFVTHEGDFEIYLKQSTLKKNANGAYSGSGNMGLYLTTTSAGAVSIPPVEVSFVNWVVPDGAKVAPGTTLSLQPSVIWDATGVNGVIQSLDGTAGTSDHDHMLATLDVTVSDAHLHKPGSTDQVSWSNLTSILDSDGNWIYKKPGLTLPETSIGWSGFHVKSQNVTIDLSTKDGGAPGNACSLPSNNTFVGVNLGNNATLIPNTAELVTLNAQVDGWVVGDYLCGKWDSTSPLITHKTIGKGWLSINSVHATFSGGNTDAVYNMEVYVPWLDTTLSGDATLEENNSANSEGGEFDFKNLTSSAVDRDSGPIHLHADSFRFGADQGGWRVMANSVFTFKDGNQAFTTQKVYVPDMHFGLSGRVYFDGSMGTSKDVFLGGSGQLGRTTINLQSVHLNAPSSGGDVLDFAFAGQLKMSQAIPASDVQVNYSVGDNYDGAGPFNSPFIAKVAFPNANSTVTAAITPVYKPGGGSQGDGDLFSGKVDLSMFGGPPITGEFRLGYSGSSDYWLTRINVPLGPTGVPLSPIPLSLYAVRGGLGYHMALDAFKDSGTLDNARVDTGTDLLFMAGMRIGTSDSFTFMMDGDFSVATGNNAGARLDFHSWLLSHEQNDPAPLNGSIVYAGSNFDVRAWGKLDLMEGTYTVDLGSSESNAALQAHIGGGDWFINAGQKTGPRIKGEFLHVSGVDSYLMLSNAGLALGGGAFFDLEAGDSDVVSAFIKGQMEIGVAITPQPHISGDFAANTEAGACVIGACASAGVTVNLHAEALPIELRGSATVDMPWPIPDVSIAVHL